MAPSKRDAELIGLACKEVGVKADTLMASRVDNVTGLVVIVIDTGQKFVFEARLLGPASREPPLTKVEKPPETTQLKAPPPETTAKRRKR